MKIVNVKQGTPEWFTARAGIPTASAFDKIITPKTGKPSSQQFGYICELIADRIMGGPPEGIESWTSRAVQYGIDTEPEARAYYELHTDYKVQQVGFVTTDDGTAGCSPDGLVGDDGGLELKCPMAKTHVEYLLKGELPDAYKCQVHASLLITGRKWWDFCSYCIGFPPFIIRVKPDDFTVAMGDCLADFSAFLALKWAAVQALMPKLPEPTEADHEAAALDLF